MLSVEELVFKHQRFLTLITLFLRNHLPGGYDTGKCRGTSRIRNCGPRWLLLISEVPLYFPVPQPPLNAQRSILSASPLSSVSSSEAAFPVALSEVPL